MINIKIDNEEVLSNKNFTIQEEMLNTPSVILNNVYPKSWETSKDYTTNFYHPNDYSKCIISDDTYYPAEAGTTVENTSFSLNDVNINKSYDFTTFKGQTSQASTPTPSSPVPVNTVTGRQDVVVCGKNFFDISTLVSKGYNGGSSTIRACQTQPIYLTPGYWTFSTDLDTTTYEFKSDILKYPPIASSIETYIYNSGFGTGTTRVLNVTTPGYFAILIREKNNANLNLDTLKGFHYQLEKGNTASSWEAYNGDTYEINLGKNLAKLDTTFDSTSNSVTCKVNDDGTVDLTGTASANANFVIATGLHYPNATYTLSCEGLPTDSDRVRIRCRNSNGSYSDSGSNIAEVTNTTIDSRITFTRDVNTVEILVFSGKASNCTLKIQLEKGQATSYAEYKTPIELCKIGNYQDYIFKNIPNTPLYDNTLEDNKWYMYKAIGKVVLNGSESWSLDSTNSRFYSTTTITDYDLPNRFYALNNYYKYNGSPYFALSGSGNFLFLGYPDANTTTVALFKTWLSTHNVSIYYVLATPTTTEIEDTTLISQLEGITLINGINNINIDTPYLPMIMTLHYNYVIEHTDSDILFCGVVKNSGNISLNPREPHYQTLQILDFKTFLSEGETLDFVIADKTIEEAIDQVIATISPYGFIKGNIQILGADTSIGAYSTKDKTAYDVFNYLADITQSRWTTRLIDENTVAVDFYDPTLLPQGTAIDYTTQWFQDNLIDDISYSYGSNDYRNKQVMTSNEVYGSILQTQTIVANGYQTQFDTEQKIGQITSITANGNQLTVATTEQKELGYSADIYYTPGNNYFESADLRSTGEILIVNYIAIVEGRQIITNGTEITRVATATGRKGVVARYENRNDATTSGELQLIGQSYIKYKGVPEIKLSVSTRSNIWNVGDRVQFNAPINELDTEYMVKQKTISRVLANPSSEEVIFYTFELTSSFNSEQAINYFDNQRAKAKGNIGQGEYITRNVDIENNANIVFYDSSVEEVTPVGDNTLNAILNAPFIN